MGATDLVFFSKLTSYKAAGEENRAGRRTLRFDYVVPAAVRGYRIRGENADAQVGFHGSFWVDAGTLDPIRLETYADEIPPALKVSASAMSIDDENSRIGATDSWLPQTAKLRMTLAKGTETINTTRFSACR